MSRKGATNREVRSHSISLCRTGFAELLKGLSHPSDMQEEAYVTKQHLVLIVVVQHYGKFPCHPDLCLDPDMPRASCLAVLSLGLSPYLYCIEGGS